MMPIIQRGLALYMAAAAALGSPLYSPGVYPVPGQSSLYSTDQSTAPPFPGNLTTALPATKNVTAGPDDILWQNLLSAEWVIYSLYQTAVNTYTSEDFVKAGFPNTTWSSLATIRDNEAGHLQLFYSSISDASVKPGPCKYEFGLDASEPAAFLALQVLIEIASMTFLTGFVQEAQLPASKGALTAVAATETRHEVWSLIEAWGASPFAGPVDTSFPYAKELLSLTTQFIVDGSCPTENPPYPNPSQDLPVLTLAPGTESIAPGSEIQFEFSKSPAFSGDANYYAVFFHAAYNISVPFDTQGNTTVIPEEIEALGVVPVVIADSPGAASLNSVLAGPSLLLYQPAGVGASLAVSA